MLIFNNALLEPYQGAQLLNPGFLYGDGFFETMALLDDEPRHWSRHWARMQRSAKVFGKALPFSEKTIQEHIANLAKQLAIQNGVIRLSLHKGLKGLDFLLQVTPPRPHLLRKSFKLGFTNEPYDRTGPLRFIKSNNYQVYRFFLNQAKSKGLDEVILYNSKGELTEGSFSNLFFEKDNCLYTPHIDCGLLPGIMRSIVIESAKKQGKQVIEGHFQKKDLQNADTCFITNALMESKDGRFTD